MRNSLFLIGAVTILGLTGCATKGELAAVERRVQTIEAKPAPRIVVDRCYLSDWNLPPMQSPCKPASNEVLVKIEGGARIGEHKAFCCQVRAAE